MDWKIVIAAPLVAWLVVANAATLKLPENWGTDSKSAERWDYIMGVDPDVKFNGHRALAVHSVRKVGDTDYAAVTTYADNFGYEGKRVRFSGMLKTAGVETYAGVYLRSDTHTVHDWQFADVQSLPRGSDSVPGASDWHPVSVVVNIPPAAGGTMGMGLVVVGNGQAWLSDLKFEEVGNDVPVTSAPIGLDVEKVAREEQRRAGARSAGRVKHGPDNLELREATTP